MLSFINIIDRVSDGKFKQRDWGKHDGLGIHRVGYDHLTKVNLGETAPEICDHFTGKNSQYPEVARATGGENAYTIMIGASGAVWQCLPLGDIGYHARRWSYNCVGIAVIGDPRYVELPHKQYWALVDVCVLLSRVLGTSKEQIRGHDELKGGSKNTKKECPGRLLIMDDLRFEVDAVMRSTAENEAHRVGLVP